MYLLVPGRASATRYLWAFVYGRHACFQILPRECNFTILDPSKSAKIRVQLQYSRFEPVMAQCIDADAVSCMCAVHALVLEPYGYLSSSR